MTDATTPSSPGSNDDSREPEFSSTRRRLSVVIVNYRTPDYVIDCLGSLVDEIDAARDIAVVVDNGSDDGSADRIAEHVARSGWAGWVRLIPTDVNMGFAGGNNVGLWAVKADYYLLLNSDTMVHPGAVATLMETMDDRPEAGIVSPRMVIPTGSAHNSTYRFTRPANVLCMAARTRLLEWLTRAKPVVITPGDQPIEVEWTSFACALLRGATVGDVGLLDAGYFMYFDDQDYCRMAHNKGWVVLHNPAATVLHRRGGSSETVEHLLARKRLPRFYWASRTRYFAKYYGTIGLWCINILWIIGRSVSLVREIIGNKPRHTLEREWRDIWINALHPMRIPNTSETTSS